jgi:hypothetical protein
MRWRGIWFEGCGNGRLRSPKETKDTPLYRGEEKTRVSFGVGPCFARQKPGAIFDRPAMRHGLQRAARTVAGDFPFCNGGKGQVFGRSSVATLGLKTDIKLYVLTDNHTSIVSSKVPAISISISRGVAMPGMEAL